MSFSLSRRHVLSGAAGLFVAGGIARAATPEVVAEGTPFAPHSFGVLSAPKSLPPLSVKDEQGNDVPLSRFYGKPFVLHFWATWCPPCIKELPSVNATAKALGQAGPQIVTVAVRGSTVAKVRAFYNAHGIDTLPLFVDPMSSVMMETADNTAMMASLKQTNPEEVTTQTGDSMSLHGVPRSLLPNAKGQVVAESIGNLDWSADGVRHTLEALAG